MTSMQIDMPMGIILIQNITRSLSCVVFPGKMWANVCSPQIGHRGQTKEMTLAKSTLVSQQVYLGYLTGEWAIQRKLCHPKMNLSIGDGSQKALSRTLPNFQVAWRVGKSLRFLVTVTVYVGLVNPTHFRSFLRLVSFLSFLSLALSSSILGKFNLEELTKHHL